MRRFWLVPALLLLLGSIAVVAWREPPMPAPGPGQPTNLLPQQAPERNSDVASTPVATDLDSPPERVQARLGADPAAAAAELQVHVEQAGSGPAYPLPFVEVELMAGDTHLVARTNERGDASFTLAGGDGAEAAVRCALGAEAKTQLSAASPRRVLLRVTPKLLVQGKVVDAAGSPVVDAIIVLQPWASAHSDEPPPWRVARSGNDGSFALGLAVGGRIGAYHRLLGPSAMYAVVMPQAKADTPPVQQLQLTLLSPAGEIRGLVRDSRGAPVAGAEIEFRSEGRPPQGAELRAVPLRIRSQADGTFVATRLLPGAIRFAARARGHGPRSGTLQLEGSKVTHFDIHLQPGCELVGSVRLPDGTPAGGAIVAANPVGAAGDGAPATRNFTTARVEVDSNGNFRLLDLAPGPTELCAAMPRNSAQRAAEVDEVRSLRSDGPNEWHVTLGQTANVPNLRGMLVDARDRPLGEWQLVARIPGRGLLRGKSGPNGAFAMTVPPQATVDLRAYAPGRPHTVFADAVLRNVAVDAGEVRFVVGDRETGRIVGRIEEEHQQPLPATVSCWHHERAEEVRVSADDRGQLRIDDVPAGTLSVRIEHHDFASAERGDISMQSRSEVDLGTIVLGAGGTLFGTVTDAAGQPPADCQLTVVCGAANGRTQRFEADYNAGNYRFPTLPKGKHTLLVQAKGLAASSHTITIEANDNKEQPILLHAGVPRRFRVVLPPDAPSVIGLTLLPTGKTVLWQARGSVAGSTRTTRTTEFVAYLAPGAYEAIARADGDWEARTTVVFDPSDDREVTLELVKR